MTHRPPRDSFRTVRLARESRSTRSFMDYGWPGSTAVYTDRRIPTGKEIIFSDDRAYLRKRAKPCFHLKWTCQVSSFLYKFRDARLGGFSAHFDAFAFDPTSYLYRLLALYRDEPDWDRVVEEVIPSFRNNFSAINFALEFGDVTSMARQIRRQFSALRADAPRYFRRLRNRYNIRIVPGVERDVSDSVLQNNLAIQPLISDLQTVLDQYRNFGDRLGTARQRLRQGAVATKTIRKSVQFSENVELLTQLGQRVKAEVRFDGESVQVFRAKIRGSIPSSPLREYLDYVGLYPDLGTLWNALPFTFIIDYFVPIGEALEGESWIQPRIHCVWSTVSHKIEGSWKIRILGLVNQDHILLPPYQEAVRSTTCSGSFKVYSRSLGNFSLDGIDLPPIRFPSGRQMSNLLALGSALRRRNGVST